MGLDLSAALLFFCDYLRGAKVGPNGVRKFSRTLANSQNSGDAKVDRILVATFLKLIPSQNIKMATWTSACGD